MKDSAQAQAAAPSRMPGVAASVWRAVLLGEPVSKANSRRKTKRGAIIKSAKALIWCRYVEQQLQLDRQPMLSGRLHFDATLYYCTERPDLDESLLLDLLQGHAYGNDRQVRSKFVRHAIDKANPRAEIEVRPL